MQNTILGLQHFWSKHSCTLHQPYDLPIGAATLHPATFFGALSIEPCRIAYPQPCRRPADSRDGQHPNRLQRYLQFQVFIKPAPSDMQGQQNFYDLFYASLDFIGLPTDIFVIRWYKDDWASPTLGAKGEGWEIRCNGLEIAQYTYFQKMGVLSVLHCHLHEYYRRCHPILFVDKSFLHRS